MQNASKNRFNGRYKHTKSKPNSKDWDFGKKQAAISLERYHYLCASIQEKYRFIDNIAPDISKGQMFPRQGIVFKSYYEPYELDPFEGIKLHPREDGTIHPEDLKLYHELFKENWKHSEGGFLYYTGEGRAFFNIILHYHSPAKTTGSEEWDAFFEELKASGYPKGKIPCMFFAREAGCWDNDCPFLHDEKATRERRAELLEARRKALNSPTPRQRMVYSQMAYVASKKTKSGPGRGNSNSSALTSLGALSLDDIYGDDDDDEEDETEDEETKVKVPRVRQFCANAQCMAPWLRKHKGDIAPLRKCAKCQWTYYCSSACQKADWKRHKNECAPEDEVIEDDDLWSPLGTRKGTESMKINWGDN